MEDNIKVSISCLTYNHVNFIKKTLDGFLMQKTKFPFEILIHDDASQDGTEEIIREYESKYPQFIKPLYEKENQWLKDRRGSVVFNFPRAKGKYLALCEGDDYWTDPLKLQKQVDFLEKNEDFGMIYTKVKFFFENKGTFAKKSWGGSATTFSELVAGNTIPTVTAMFRANLLDLFDAEINIKERKWQMGDYPMWLFFSLKTRIHFSDEVTAVYRVLEESASHTKIFSKKEDFIKSYFDIKQFFFEYRNKEYDKDLLEHSLYSSLATNALLMNNRKLAKDYVTQIKKKTKIIKLKKIIYSSSILSTVLKLGYNLNKIN